MAPRTSLIGLPNDVLLDIIDRIPPDDISAFARASKHIHTLASKRLNVHRDKLKLYERVYVNAAPWTCFCDYLPADATNHPTIPHALDLVLAIMSDPWIASYVRELDFVMSGDETECPDCQNGLSGMVEEQNGTSDQLIDQAFKGSRGIGVWRKFTGRAALICQCSECSDHQACRSMCPAIAGLLLLIILPNLVCLTFEGWDAEQTATQEFADYIEELIGSICTGTGLQRDNTSREVSPLPLSKLRKIVVAHCDTLLPVLSALALPTVDHLETIGSYTCFANALEEGRSTSRILKEFKPDLKTIAFENGWTYMEDVVNLSKSQPHLESFVVQLGSLEDEDAYIDEEERREAEERPPWLTAGDADRCLDRLMKDEHGVLAERGLCARVIGQKGTRTNGILSGSDDRTIIIERRKS